MLFNLKSKQPFKPTAVANWFYQTDSSIDRIQTLYHLLKSFFCLNSWNTAWTFDEKHRNIIFKSIQKAEKNLTAIIKRNAIQQSKLWLASFDDKAIYQKDTQAKINCFYIIEYEDIAAEKMTHKWQIKAFYPNHIK